MYVLGGTQTDFARHFAREGKDLAEVVGETVDAALDDARVAPSDIGCVHVGNAFGEVFVGQAQLGAMPATARPALVGVPAARHEAACASGGVAVLAAMADLEAGRYDVALVLGVEQEKNLSGEAAARAMGTAAWAGHEGQGARYLWPHMFARLADVYAERFGLDPRHLAAIAEKNLGNAKHNGRAQTRAWTFDARTFGAGWGDDAVNAPVEGRLRRLDCAQVTDGAAALVLASEPAAERWAAARGVRLASLARIAGWGHRTAGLGLDDKLAAPGPSGHVFPHLRECARDAWRRAGIGLDALHLLEVHDCFSITEYMLIDHLDVTAPGEAYKAIEDGRVLRGGRLPINPSGGLIGGGHPVGATGVRMLLDAARQVTGRAADTQVPGARWAGTLNIGGSATTVVAFAVHGPGERAA
ncbi:MAG: thiolase domain-containing protein [Deltaproteobacteria bacterium]|nr:thiolase domain-containing protein [Deltaproteobacteria bacterium]